MKRFITLLIISIFAMGGVALACKPKVVDVCPNIDGVQQTVPDGQHLDDNKDCVADVVVVPPVDTSPVTVVDTPAPDQTPAPTPAPDTQVIPDSPPADFQGK